MLRFLRLPLFAALAVAAGVLPACLLVPRFEDDGVLADGLREALDGRAASFQAERREACRVLQGHLAAWKSARDRGDVEEAQRLARAVEADYQTLGRIVREEKGR